MTVEPTYADIRESVRRLCAGFPGPYWQAKDRDRGYPVEFVDAALLPASKEAMKFAFRYVWAISEPDMRMMAEVIYLNLSRFQDGVGVVPIAPERRDTDPATADEI